MESKILHLGNILTSLKEVQENFEGINEKLNMGREHLSDTIIDNLMSSYTLLDFLLVRKESLIGNDIAMLELNHRILCGSDPKQRYLFNTHINATRDRYYSRVQKIKDWYYKQEKKSMWFRASGVYTRILSHPQLYQEGNHRTGSLIASYKLIQHNMPPFILTVDNAVPYFNLSSSIKFTNQKKFWNNKRIRDYTDEFRDFLKEYTNEKFMV